MPDNLKFSVITPSFNQGQFIEDTIKSVLAQNYDHFEHIIMDGGSTDNTIEILKKYPHIIWKSEKDKGQTHAINKALKIATGDIICWLNSDDMVCKNAFTKINNFFIANSSLSCVTGNLIRIDKYGKTLVKEKAVPLDYDGLLNKGQRVQQMSTFFRKSVFDKVGLLDESYHFTMDHELWVRIASNFKFEIVNEDLAMFRIYQDSKTGSSELKFVKELLRIKRKYKARMFSSDTFKLWFMFVKEPFKKIPYLKSFVRKLKKNRNLSISCRIQ